MRSGNARPDSTGVRFWDAPSPAERHVTFGLKPRWFLVAPVALLWPLMMRKRAQRVLDVTVETAKMLWSPKHKRASGSFELVG